MNVEIIYNLWGVIFPVFILIGLGSFLSYKKILNSTTNSGLQRYIFTTAMPIMIFVSISKYSLSEIFNTQYIISIVAVFFITLGLSILVASKFFNNTDKSAFMNGLTSTFSNSTYIGLTICYFAFGDVGVAPAVIYIIVTSFLIIVPILLCRYSEMQQSGVKKYSTLLKKFVVAFTTNPLVIGPSIAILFLFADIQLPNNIMLSLDMVAKTASPMALISIGCSLYFICQSQEITEEKTQFKEISFIVLIKLILSPLIAFLIIMPLDINPIWKAIFVVQTAMPPGIVSYIVCTQENTFIRRNAFSILYGTLFSIITLPIIIGFYI